MRISPRVFTWCRTGLGSVPASSKGLIRSDCLYKHQNKAGRRMPVLIFQTHLLAALCGNNSNGGNQSRETAIKFNLITGITALLGLESFIHRKLQPLRQRRNTGKRICLLDEDLAEISDSSGAILSPQPPRSESDLKLT